MVKGNLKLSVVEHIILRNMWEYYILADEPDTTIPDPDIVYALVITRTTELNTIFPAAGYSWADEMPIRGRLLGERLDWRDE